MSSKTKLPHITRIIPSRWLETVFSFLILALLVTILGINIWQIHIRQYLLHPIAKIILQQPHYPGIYTVLASEYYRHQNQTMASRYLAFERSNGKPDGNVLGDTTDAKDGLFRSWSQEASVNSEKIKFFEKLNRKYEDYTDAYLLTALAYYQQGDKESALKYLEIAKNTDPFNMHYQILSTLPLK